MKLNRKTIADVILTLCLVIGFNLFLDWFFSQSYPAASGKGAGKPVAAAHGSLLRPGSEFRVVEPLLAIGIAAFGVVVHSSLRQRRTNGSARKRSAEKQS